MDKAIYSRQGEFLKNLLVKLRHEAGLNQRQLAAKLNREHNLVARLEQGERRLDVVEFFWLCKACDANPEKIAVQLMHEFEALHHQRTPRPPKLVRG